MKAYLIDPEHRTLTIVEVTDGITQIYELLGCERITAAPLNDMGDAVYVDDEGLSKPNSFFLIETYPQPLAGKGLVVGTDDDGNDIDPSVSEEWLRDNLDFGTIMTIGGTPFFWGDRHRRAIT